MGHDIHTVPWWRSVCTVLQGLFAATPISGLCRLKANSSLLADEWCQYRDEGNLLEVGGKDAFVPAAPSEVRGLAAMA